MFNRCFPCAYKVSQLQLQTILAIPSFSVGNSVFTYFVVYFYPLTLLYFKLMTTLIAKHLVHDLRKVQETVMNHDN